jgi:hypothetical protein
MEVMYITYEEAQKLIPFFKVASQDRNYGKEAMESARRILPELENVRERDYSPLKGKQIILRSGDDRQFLIDAISALGVR